MSLLSTIGAGLKGVLTPSANSPANGVNVGDVLKAAVVPAAITILQNAGLFFPATGPWIALATFGLHLLQLYGPAGPVTVPPATVQQFRSSATVIKPRPYDESGADY